MAYADGFVIPVPQDKLKEYQKMARVAAKVWKDHGAIDYKEWVGDDLQTHCGISFLKMAKAKEGDTIVFAYITYKSKAHRDKVNKLVMADPRLKKYEGLPMPFDMKKMATGGFALLVDGK